MDFTPMVMLVNGKVGLLEIYTVAWPNRMSCIKAKSFRGYWTKKRRSETQSLRSIWCPIADLKMEGVTWPGVWAASRNWEQSPVRGLKASKDLSSTKSKKFISANKVNQLGNKVFLKTCRHKLSMTDMLVWGLRILSEGPSHVTPEFAPAQLWVHTSVWLILQVCSTLLCSNTELI